MKVKLILYILTLSFVLYLFLILKSIIDPSFSLSQNYCENYSDSRVIDDVGVGTERVEGGECILFRSDLDEQMYYYNKGVSKRSLFWLVLGLIITSFISKLIAAKFYTGKEEYNKVFGFRDKYEKIALYYIAIPFFILIGCTILQFTLPKPADYLPLITYQLDKWEKNMKNRILSGEIQIDYKGKIIK